MNRHFYFSFILFSMLNLILFVPSTLIAHRYDGAVSSIVVSVIVGTLLAYLYTSTFEKFPGLGLPEILHKFHPNWIVTPTLLFYAFMWLSGASIALVGFSVLINRFINPDTNSIYILALLVAICIYSSSRSTLSIMFIIEMGLICNVPLILFLLSKSVFSPNVNWDAIRTIANYGMEMPDLQSVSAATYIFTGYVTISLFNRAFPANFRYKYRWTIPVFGLLVLLLSFFIPIGFHGTESVDNYLYVWSITADSMMMRYGFIERVMFVFLILYLNLTLLFVTTAWHHAMEFIKSCSRNYEPRVDPDKTPMRNWVIVSIFGVLTLLFHQFFTERESLIFANYWLVVRMLTEILLVVWLLIVSRGKSTRRELT
ncbi:hypothetical protein EBB07_01080 [Paenibacillaceae bacterium]|nr:hypothetical protein EBB07_01080 [Paenibacillaceae bacterium]